MKRYVVGSLLVAAIVLVAGSVQLAVADGSETLGPPSIPIASGTGVVAKGTGMLSQPGTIMLDIPAGASVEQVLLYWEGFNLSATNDDTITISDGVVTTDVTGILIGGPDFFFGSNFSSTFRADITGLGLIGPGTNTLTLSGMDFDSANNGAGLLVIIDDGSGLAEIQLLDGNDLAFIGFEPPRDTTVPQTLVFPSSPAPRMANLAMFFSSVEGPASNGGSLRPTTITVDVEGDVTEINNQLGSFDGDEWDTLLVTVPVPAGASSMTIQALSEDRLGTGALPASFVWSGVGLSIPPAEEPAIDIEKATNGSDADSPNGADVPQIAPGDTVTWSYVVTNIGTVTILNVQAFDDTLGVALDCPQTTLEPGESMMCNSISAPADQLEFGDPAVVPGTCGGVPNRPLYENMARTTGESEAGTFVEDEDASHYCNPEEPAIDIEKATNGSDADSPNGADVPQIAPGDTVTWSYVVTNIGTVTILNVQAFDDTLGVALDCPQTTLEPGESMMCNSISAPADQLEFGDPAVVPGTCGGVPNRPLYENMARTTGESEAGTFVEDEDPSHYCNPEADLFGCTPGFWKTNPGAWALTPYSPNQTIQSVFSEASDYVGNDKLIEGLQYGGGPGASGGARILLRAAIASLLNASHPVVNPGFPLSPTAVIDSVNAALASGSRGVMLALATSLDNDNNAGDPSADDCPLDADESNDNSQPESARTDPGSRVRTPGRTQIREFGSR